MALRFPAGLLVNLGEVPKESYKGRLPTTRMGTAALVRQALTQAQGYRQKMKSESPDKRPAQSAKLEALGLALERKLPVIFAAHRADDLQTALRAVTLDAARILGIDDRFGSLEAGKAADLVLYDGDPFEHATHVTHTLVGGRVVYDREGYLKLPFARRALPLLGGSGVGCCMG